MVQVLIVAGWIVIGGAVSFCEAGRGQRRWLCSHLGVLTPAAVVDRDAVLDRDR